MRNSVKRNTVAAILIALLILLSSCGEKQTVLEAGIESVSKYGNIVLTVGPQSMENLGFEAADMINVKIGDISLEMPIGTSYSDVDSGKPVCVLRKDPDGGRGYVILAINSGNLISSLNIAEIRSTDEEPGYEIVWSDGFGENSAVSLTMSKKQGYAEEYAMHQIAGARTNKREDYADLSDAEYANFRSVETSGMGKNTLFRSSSPINPALNRNKEADSALSYSLVRTVINMADNSETMKNYSDYYSTVYSTLDVAALNMGVDFESEDFREKLAEGFRYIASHEGPYLIHCNEGKDRTGFAAAILECLMGASAEEVICDYMITYYNYYGITAESEQYLQIANSNIKSSLSKAFGIGAIDKEGVSLADYALDYLKNLGMTDEEISLLKANLGKDYGGIE
ncbi:MAG: tyrosine-protein phosphatase [Clostridia bacterium]|nr:tyrosine-protein phosphatase [Clostridia bacterium]